MNYFSEKVNKELHLAGWFQGREIDTTNFRQKVLSENYLYSDAADRFLKEFGGIKILFYLRNNEEDSMHFNVIKAVDDVSSLWIHEAYASRLYDFSLCPIGQVYSDHMTLMINDRGLIYGGFDDDLFFISNTGLNAIESIMTNESFKKIH